MAFPDSPLSASVFSFGDFRADSRSGQLTKYGLRIKLQEKPFQILVYLLAHPGHVVTREDLRVSIWGTDTYLDFDHSLNIAVNKLREALCDSAETPLYIETLPRRGYRFIAPVVETTSNGRTEAPPVPIARPEHRRRTLRSPWLVAGAAGVAVVALSLLVAFRHSPAVAPPKLEFHARDWALISRFENRTAEPIFDGVLEAALSRELTNSQFVSVVPPERVNDTLELMRLAKNSPVDATVGREICLRDGAIRALVAGRIDKIGSHFILSAQLIEPATGRTVHGFEQDAGSEAMVLPAVHALANDVRQSLGEQLSEIQRSETTTPKVTTP